MTAGAAVRTVTDTDEEVLDLLARTTPPGDGIPFVAGYLSWPGFTTAEELECAWEDFQAAILHRDALATGTAHWVEYFAFGDLRGTEDGEQACAIQMACAEADEARRRLLTGSRR